MILINNDPHKTKLDSRALKYIFLEYSRIQWCYYPSLDHFLVSADVTFFKYKSTFDSESSSLEFEEDNVFL